MTIVTANPSTESLHEVTGGEFSKPTETRCAVGADRRRSPIAFVLVFLTFMSVMGSAHAEFWYEDFTDGNLSDSGIEWSFIRDHSVSPDGLLLSTDDSCCLTAAFPDWPADRQGWSIRVRGRLKQNHGFFGAATGAMRGKNSEHDTWSLVNAAGEALLGSGLSQTSNRIETDLHPFDDDLVIQLDTLDGVIRLWAWPEGEQPEEHLAPLIEERFDLPLAFPAIWARSNDGPSSTTFRWMSISTKHMPITMRVPLSDLIGDFSGNDVLDIADIDELASAVRASKVDQPLDLNQDGIVDSDDHKHWVREIKQTWIGDANLDGEFNSNDFVEALQAGKYELGEAASWSQGDWNADGVFNSSDILVAFEDGGYEVGARNAAVSAVPEPSAAILLPLGLLGVVGIRKRMSIPRYH